MGVPIRRDLCKVDMLHDPKIACATNPGVLVGKGVKATRGTSIHFPLLQQYIHRYAP